MWADWIPSHRTLCQQRALLVAPLGIGKLKIRKMLQQGDKLCYIAIVMIHIRIATWMYILVKTCIFPVLPACCWHKMARTGFKLPLLEWPCSSLFSRKIAKLRVAQAQQKLFILTKPRAQYGQDNKLILEDRLQRTVSNCVVVLKLASMAQSTAFPPVSIPFHVHPSKTCKVSDKCHPNRYSNCSLDPTPIRTAPVLC